MGLILKDVWRPGDLCSDVAVQHVRSVTTLNDLVELGRTFIVAMTGDKLDEVGISGDPDVGKSRFVSGITGAWRRDLTIDTKHIEGVGTVIHADLGNPSVYKNPIDLIELRRRNHADRHGKDCLKGANILEHPGNCQWTRVFGAAVFVEGGGQESEAREVIFAASRAFEESQYYQGFLERTRRFSRGVVL